MPSSRKILVFAGTMIGVSVLGSLASARVASAGGGDAERCPDTKLPVCRDVEVCNKTGTCTTDYYYFPGSVE